MSPKKKEPEKPSMFRSLIEQARLDESEAESPDTTDPQPQPPPSPESDVSAKERGRGRPKGRRSNPNYTQISAYVPLQLYLEVQQLLLQQKITSQQRSGIDVSGLIEELLAKWVEQQRN